MEPDNSAPINELLPGTLLCGGKYRIDKKIGEGGFGITYKATQSGLNRTVCIKEYFLAGRCVRESQTRTVQVPGSTVGLFGKYRQAFVREAKMLASLRHPNIVEVIDVFDEFNTSYMVMSFIEGRSLQSMVDERGPLPYPEVVNYIAQITNAVGYIHQHNILHRDIKPDNIMITADFKAVLIDFGSAREFEHDKTQMHTSILTHGYAPTEQYSNTSRKGCYTDIYAIGATMYFILTGKVPVDAAARAIEQMPAPIELVPDLPEEANRTILKAMQIKAENRHQSIQEFMDDLRNIKPSVLIDETLGGENKNKKLYVWLGVAAAVVAGLCIYLFLMPSADQIADNVRAAIEQEAAADTIVTRNFSSLYLYPMIEVEGGSFVMGDDISGTPDSDCKPHNVTLDGFYIGQSEVSQKLWQEIMGDNPSIHKGDSLPVENVSYKLVEEFISKLNAQTGLHYTLPTEAQWEYAARGGNQSHHYKYAGSESTINVWYKENGPRNVNIPNSENELGIFQMNGNVSEWCADMYSETFYKDDVSNPINRAGKEGVVRGGSYKSDSSEKVTVYYRDYRGINSGWPGVGFRLVLNHGSIPE